MSKLLLAALFAVLLLPFGSNLSYAQTSNCNVGPYSWWPVGNCVDGTADQIGVQEFDDGIDDMEMNFFVFSKSGSYKYQNNPTSAIKYAISYLLTKHNKIPHYNECVDITLHIPNCWRMSYYNELGIFTTRLDPCSNTCCEYIYRVCYDVNGTAISADLITPGSSNEECTVDQCTIKVCGNSQYFPNSVTYDDGPPETMSVDGLPITPRIGGNTEGQIQSTTTLSVFPNPNNGKVQISLSSTEKGNLTFKVFNSLGSCVKTLDFDKGTAELNFNCDFTTLINGVYYLKAYINNELIKETSFVLTK